MTVPRPALSGAAGPLARGPATARWLTRREAIGGALTVAGALTLAGCGAGSGARVSAVDGSTLRARWVDPHGDGQLQRGPGEPLLARTALGGAVRTTRELARFAHLTDTHVMDAASPARVPFLARLGPPLQSTFRPQEALTATVLHGAVNALRAFGPELVIQGGDLIDNAQHNELERALALLAGGRVHPGSGPHGYYGVQSPQDSDPFYYRPDIDAPRYPGMLPQAMRPFTSPGLGVDWVPVLGDHDPLLAGELVPNAQTAALALGDRALWNFPSHLRLPDGFRLRADASPDGPPDPAFVSSFLAQALAGPTVRVPPDPSRYELSFAQVTGRLWAGARAGSQPGLTLAPYARAAGRLDYVRDVGSSLRLIVLDIVRRAGGSGGLVVDGQPQWLQEQLADTGGRWAIVVTHQPLPDAVGGGQLLAVMDRSPRVIAALAGHIHRNQIVARATVAGGYWLITTASLIDFPQQARALRLLETADGGVALETWMLDHVGDGRLGRFARELSYLDAQGGRPQHFAGGPRDRNVTLYRRA